MSADESTKQAGSEVVDGGTLGDSEDAQTTAVVASASQGSPSAGQGAVAATPPSAKPTESSSQSSIPPGSRDVSIWLLPVGAVALIAGAGWLGGVFWGATALTLVVTIAVAVITSAMFPEHKKGFAIAVGVLVGIALMFILIAQRPGILDQLNTRAVPALPSPSASASGTP